MKGGFGCPTGEALHISIIICDYSQDYFGAIDCFRDT